MWHTLKVVEDEGRIERHSLFEGELPVSYERTIELWQADAVFRKFFVHVLASSAFGAFRWETPPVNLATASQPFEFVLLNSPGLQGTPDPEPFSKHFPQATDGVVSFPNLSGSSFLIAPIPVVGPLAYGHLADFVRNAPEEQVHALWKCVGHEMHDKLRSKSWFWRAAKPIWLSTAGYGVSWLHVRLDSRPKYYGYAPYKVWLT